MARLPISKNTAENAGFWTKKKLGQHLLRDSTVVRDILAALNAGKEEAVLEIGPGLGALTESLLMLDLPLAAVEVDPAACAALRERFGDLKQFTLVEGDVLKVDLSQICRQAFGDRPFHVAANLPYYITSPILAQVLESGLPFGRMVVLAQKEVADRLAAKPGNKTYGALSVMAQYRCKVTMLRKVLPGAFTPPPKVDSGLVLFERHQGPGAAGEGEAWFFRVVRAAFGKRRKTLRNSLKMGGLGLEDTALDQAFDQSGISAGARPETLDINQFAALAKALAQLQE